MKLICDCGNQLKFVVDDKNNKDEYGCIYTSKDGKIDLSSEHDQLWITCNECGKAIYTFT
jgi:hypothetical protein